MPKPKKRLQSEGVNVLNGVLHSEKFLEDRRVQISLVDFGK